MSVIKKRKWSNIKVTLEMREWGEEGWQHFPLGDG